MCANYLNLFVFFGFWSLHLCIRNVPKSEFFSAASQFRIRLLFISDWLPALILFQFGQPIWNWQKFQIGRKISVCFFTFTVFRCASIVQRVRIRFDFGTKTKFPTERSQRSMLMRSLHHHLTSKQKLPSALYVCFMLHTNHLCYVHNQSTSH